MAQALLWMRGYYDILTNAHMIANTSYVTVQHAKEIFPATIKGVNEVADLALHNQKFPALKFGISELYGTGVFIILLSPDSFWHCLHASLADTQKGAITVTVWPGSPASKAGL